MKTASRTQTLRDEVFGYWRERAAHLTNPYQLHVGDSSLEPPQAFSQPIAPGVLRYPPIRGTAGLIGQISDWRSCDKRRIQIVPGATAGVSIVFEALFEPGDHVAAFAPYWPLVRGAFKRGELHGHELSIYRDDTIDEALALERLAKLCEGGQLKGLYWNSPHNPTGHVFSTDFEHALARLVKRHGLWLISDVVYEELAFGRSRLSSNWASYGVADQVVEVGSFSKAYAVAGARVGYVIADETAMAAISAIQTYATYATPYHSQVAIEMTLRTEPDFATNVCRQYEQAAQVAAKTLDVPCPPGGTFLFLPLRDADALNSFFECALGHGVLMTPGLSCGNAFDRFVRICFTSETLSRVEEALTLIKGDFERARASSLGRYTLR